MEILNLSVKIFSSFSTIFYFIKPLLFYQAICIITSCWCHSKTFSVSLVLAFELLSREISCWFVKLILAHQKLKLIKISLHRRQYFWNPILISNHFHTWEGKKKHMTVFIIFTGMERHPFLGFCSFRFLISKMEYTGRNLTANSLDYSSSRYQVLKSKLLQLSGGNEVFQCPSKHSWDSWHILMGLSNGSMFFWKRKKQLNHLISFPFCFPDLFQQMILLN